MAQGLKLPGILNSRPVKLCIKHTPARLMYIVIISCRREFSFHLREGWKTHLENESASKDA